MPRCGVDETFQATYRGNESFFLDGWKEEARSCKFPRFHLGGNDRGKGDTIMPEKSRIQNMWGEGHGGESKAGESRALERQGNSSTLHQNSTFLCMGISNS
jgi:hypothetical protein